MTCHDGPLRWEPGHSGDGPTDTCLATEGCRWCDSNGVCWVVIIPATHLQGGRGNALIITEQSHTPSTFGNAFVNANAMFPIELRPQALEGPGNVSTNVIFTPNNNTMGSGGDAFLLSRAEVGNVNFFVNDVARIANSSATNLPVPWRLRSAVATFSYHGVSTVGTNNFGWDTPGAAGRIRPAIWLRQHDPYTGGGIETCQDLLDWWEVMLPNLPFAGSMADFANWNCRYTGVAPDETPELYYTGNQNNVCELFELFPFLLPEGLICIPGNVPPIVPDPARPLVPFPPRTNCEGLIWAPGTGDWRCYNLCEDDYCGVIVRPPYPRFDTCDTIITAANPAYRCVGDGPIVVIPEDFPDLSGGPYDNCAALMMPNGPLDPRWFYCNPPTGPVVPVCPGPFCGLDICTLFPSLCGNGPWPAGQFEYRISQTTAGDLILPRNSHINNTVIVERRPINTLGTGGWTTHDGGTVSWTLGGNSIGVSMTAGTSRTSPNINATAGATMPGNRFVEACFTGSDAVAHCSLRTIVVTDEVIEFEYQIVQMASGNLIINRGATATNTVTVLRRPVGTPGTGGWGTYTGGTVQWTLLGSSTGVTMPTNGTGRTSPMITVAGNDTATAPGNREIQACFTGSNGIPVCDQRTIVVTATREYRVVLSSTAQLAVARGAESPSTTATAQWRYVGQPYAAWRTTGLTQPTFTWSLAFSQAGVSVPNAAIGVVSATTDATLGVVNLRACATIGSNTPVWSLATDSYVQNSATWVLESPHLSGTGGTPSRVPNPIPGVDYSIQIANRTDHWNGFDVSRTALGLSAGNNYEITVTGRVPGANPGTNFRIGASEAPWNHLADAPVAANGSFTVTALINSATLANPSFTNGFRVTTVDDNQTFIIDNITVTRIGLHCSNASTGDRGINVVDATRNCVFNVHGGTVVPNQTQSVANTATECLAGAPLTTRTGFSFMGWYTAAVGGTRVTATTPINPGTYDIVLHARWFQYRINGGTGAPGTAANPALTNPFGTGVIQLPASRQLTPQVTLWRRVYIPTNSSFGNWQQRDPWEYGTSITWHQSVTPSWHSGITANTNTLGNQGRTGPTISWGTNVPYDTAVGDLMILFNPPNYQITIGLSQGLSITQVWTD